ncbi:MAG TPA: nucleotidyltransferase family protein [Chitinivibrionales bacterium]|jgi:predicted nucleotidyltransferase|nr:nucleotidyltransferase family protein [Chitinivibrionales bacterium]
METREQILSKLREHLSELRLAFGVMKIGLFGSFARNTQRQDSDIDIIVEFDRPMGMKFMDFADYLQDLLKRPVDVLTPAGIEGIRNPEIAAEIRRSVIYV